jgi:uncharacterized coiled-coil DUF342 family protein
MTNNKPLTKDDLLESLAEFYSGQIKPDLDNLEKRLKNKLGGKIDSLEVKVEEVRNDVKWIKDDIKGIKADLSLTVSKKDFNKLKSRVDRYHPSN